MIDHSVFLSNEVYIDVVIHALAFLFYYWKKISHSKCSGISILIIAQKISQSKKTPNMRLTYRKQEPQTCVEKLMSTWLFGEDWYAHHIFTATSMG